MTASLGPILPVLLASIAAPAFAAPPKAQIAYLSGKAAAGSDDQLRPVKQGDKVELGEIVQTEKESRLELKLLDGSRVRLDGDTKVKLTQATFKGTTRNEVSVRLFVGRLWAKVVRAAGGTGSFEVETDNAVGGVRGTSFTVLASADASALVRVYSGSVGVRPSAGKGGPRREVPGPKEIDRRQWEEIIATAMKQVRISAAGDIAPAEDFEDSGDNLEWAQWNQGRDGKLGPKAVPR